MRCAPKTLAQPPTPDGTPDERDNPVNGFAGKPRSNRVCAVPRWQCARRPGGSGLIREGVGTSAAFPLTMPQSSRTSPLQQGLRRAAMAGRTQVRWERIHPRRRRYIRCISVGPAAAFADKSAPTGSAPGRDDEGARRSRWERIHPRRGWYIRCISVGPAAVFADKSAPTGLAPCRDDEGGRRPGGSGFIREGVGTSAAFPLTMPQSSRTSPLPQIQRRAAMTRAHAGPGGSEFIREEVGTSAAFLLSRPQSSRTSPLPQV
jgi:hypothetical protein